MRKSTALILAAALTTAAVAVPEAEARWWRGGWGRGGGGLAAGLAIGAAGGLIAGSLATRAYGYGYPGYGYGGGYGYPATAVGYGYGYPATTVGYAEGYGYPATTVGYGQGYGYPATTVGYGEGYGYPVATAGYGYGYPGAYGYQPPRWRMKTRHLSLSAASSLLRGAGYRSRVAVRRTYGFRSAAIYTPRARFYRPAMYGQRVVYGARPAYRSP